MNADRNACTSVPGADGEPCVQPRVVILDDGDAPHVEVLELSPAASVGTSFAHCGRCWRVTGLRTKARVLIAEPIRH